MESGSFVAWPEQYLCRRGEKRHYSKEIEVLKDPLHPDRDVSPRTLVSRDRQLRGRTKATKWWNMSFVRILKGLGHFMLKQRDKSQTKRIIDKAHEKSNSTFA